MTTDNLAYENALYKAGYQHICGIDEAGRGPLAGPVVAAAVIFKKGFYHKDINDSKKLSVKQRDILYDLIIDNAVSIGISIIDHHIIDDINILEAARLAMQEAMNKLQVKPDYALTDHMDIKGIPYTSLIKGDQLSMTIAAASIIAKVTRDRIMIDYDKQYPLYGFKDHKGYGTKKHLEALKLYGITPIHRKTFKPVTSIYKQ
ncbi:MAG: ribonuclease HII [Acholeplasma sp.]